MFLFDDPDVNPWFPGHTASGIFILDFGLSPKNDV